MLRHFGGARSSPAPSPDQPSWRGNKTAVILTVVFRQQHRIAGPLDRLLHRFGAETNSAPVGYYLRSSKKFQQGYSQKSACGRFAGSSSARSAVATMQAMHKFEHGHPPKGAYRPFCRKFERSNLMASGAEGSYSTVPNRRRPPDGNYDRYPTSDICRIAGHKKKPRRGYRAGQGGALGLARDAHPSQTILSKIRYLGTILWTLRDRAAK